jgi:hypothetical protein
MDETGERKIPSGECRCDGPHVRSDCGLALRVILLSLKDHPSAIRQRLEDVLRRVLIDAHRRFAALL